MFSPTKNGQLYVYGGEGVNAFQGQEKLPFFPPSP